MRRSLLLLVALAGCAAVRSAVPAPPCTTDLYDLMRRASTEVELVACIGAAHVERGEVGLGEGETSPGTLLFPHDGTRRAEILWWDPERRTGPALAQLDGTESVWSVRPGISLGVSLDSLEILNGGPFELYGFEWDYQGTVASWLGGRLAGATPPGMDLVARLVPFTDDPGVWEGAVEVSGDAVFPSSHPAMRRLNPRVYQLRVVVGE
jgi:hypothetical protein